MQVIDAVDDAYLHRVRNLAGIARAVIAGQRQSRRHREVQRIVDPFLIRSTSAANVAHSASIFS
ncbi:hypothetical protein AU196_18200 [Mycobacterium sp. IS-1742]|uniref:hypothetical protein n=1 Tax=Mycobacterium sp. IS-1742 TaxID=1772285 RepID=UPI00074046E4|nr:hypothetical protein [Mycobacterium sp. IS-1742]KUI31264.1 hypothetical protein AU196_18200 [Mycobacterium sp. IS-1742]